MALKYVFNAITGKFDVVDISGGGSTSVITIEIDFGIIPTRSKTFTIIDLTVSTSSLIIINQSGAAATGRSADENEMDPLIFSGTPGTGTFTLIASALNGPVVGKYKVNYIVG